MKVKTLSLAATMAMTVWAGAAAAATYQASIYLPATYPQAKNAYAGMFDRVREATGGKMKFDIHYGGSLLPAKTTINGMRDGVADVGFVYPSYTPAELPIQAFLNSASFVADDSLAVALAYSELNFTNPDAQAEWAKFNVVFTGAFSTPVYNMMCNTEVTTTEEAKGKRMRTAGAAFTGLADSLGATAVSVPIGDAYSGMQRGSLDCILADPTNMITASFNEVVTDMTVVPLGVVTGANWVFNKDSWGRFSDEERALLKDEMALALARTQLEFDQSVTAAFDDAKAKNISLHDASAGLEEHIDGFKAEFIANLVSNATNVPHAQEIFDEYAELQKTWSARLDEIDRTDDAAVAALIREHLMSKLAQ
ncbi:C4-dicarboxylate TRAP transporter substrate-binding protein [Pseudodonghicola flavimaris]|uniref:C4-dicarboxylate TRAP transporter substrate-binding protein n=1 Tax=Pseudodonghicola flavimaris TaxID=3050036 RepID=A0ABT7F1B6_9RHOB|nr:C4-dicarboxylate TRAP transporter substrate-binding protein [Pseudodonghicola flavimaris]MDK3018400.1 C4-dicarboxylate TRAP transporter substrate-binding protein [Pseudodonghicola flavimaris]